MASTQKVSCKKMQATLKIPFVVTTTATAFLPLPYLNGKGKNTLNK
jgi:hypothetical protein